MPSDVRHTQVPSVGSCQTFIHAEDKAGRVSSREPVTGAIGLVTTGTDLSSSFNFQLLLGLHATARATICKCNAGRESPAWLGRHAVSTFFSRVQERENFLS